MKTKLFMFAALFCCLLSTQSFSVISDTEANKPKGKIELKKRTTGFRSGTSTVVEAYADDHLLTVDVENYTGDVYVQVFGADGATQLIFAACNHGNATLDISSLPQGIYTVTIVLNSTYEGVLVK